MMRPKLTISYCVTVFFLMAASANADYSQHEKAAVVVDRLVNEFQFDQDDAFAVLAMADTEQRILDSMANAAEKTKTWTAYRKSFLSESRIQNGARFLRKNRATFDEAEQQYGVPAVVIAAILGVETNFGGYTGKANVLNALATLAFEHPRRGKFFSSELVEYIVLCREQGWRPEAQLGSYAGAMGMSQFMPSNYRRLAVDGNADNAVNLFDVDDAVHSIANYLRHHGWQPGKPVAMRAAVEKTFDSSVIGKGLRPNKTVHELAAAGYFPQQKIAGDLKARVVRFNDADGDEFWFGFQNFYTISRYNPRSKYAMAVYQLSEQIEEAYLNLLSVSN